MEFTIDDRQALLRLREDRSLKRQIRHIALPGPPSEERQRLEQVINRTYFACGCKSGAVAVQLTLVLAALSWFLGVGGVEWSWTKLALTLLGAALAGKVAGLVLSRFRLKRALAEVAAGLP